ncbi:cupin domain-containing protein [Paraburkholderia phosphatilytica]|uniref:cupin domain-containing protein n=1 Tax=Paraburkholderia phosphatilytica TaxID=2282883 RepID=UPI001F0C8C15|nr:cupin domain-containing protein [Paraburkholderia phosphatilytica]
MTSKDLQAPALAGLFVKGGRARYTIESDDWQPMMIGDTPLAGFSWIPVAEEDGAWSSYWMRIDAGARSPSHRHESIELLMILEGIFTDDDGTDFVPGETVTYQAGTTHRSFSRDGCVVLVVTREASSIA